MSWYFPSKIKNFKRAFGKFDVICSNRGSADSSVEHWMQDILRFMGRLKNIMSGKISEPYMILCYDQQV
jgi:hypothetical protein